MAPLRMPSSTSSSARTVLLDEHELTVWTTGEYRDGVAHDKEGQRSADTAGSSGALCKSASAAFAASAFAFS